MGSEGSLQCSQEPAQRLCVTFRNKLLLRQGIGSPNPQAGGPPLIGCPRLLSQYICSYPHIWRPSPPATPQRMPYHGDRDSHNIDKNVWKN